MQGFLNTLAFHGWTGFDVDLSLQRRRELAWDSASTSVPTAGGYNPVVGSTLFYQGHVQEAKKTMAGNGQQHHPADGISVLSEGNGPWQGAKSSPVYQGWWQAQHQARYLWQDPHAACWTMPHTCVEALGMCACSVLLWPWRQLWLLRWKWLASVVGGSECPGSSFCCA